MHCQYCRRQIGWFRRQFDREYCSGEHRRRGRLNSARALRDAGELEPLGLWLPTTDASEQKRAKSGSRSGAMVAVLICGFMLALLWVSPNEGPAAATAAVKYSSQGTQQTGSFLQNLLPGWKAVRLREDFQAEMSDWIGARGAANDWSRAGGVTKPAGLRLWAPSLNLTDYQLEFEGQIERKAMSWTFRATNLENYYATKINVSRQGQGPRAEIVRYVMLDGKTSDRVQLPLPMPVLDDSIYHVKVKIKGSYFVTSVNGQIVDSWSDSRIPKGGVGFFADRGETAAIHWVTLDSAEPGFFGRLFATTLFLPPGL